MKKRLKKIVNCTLVISLAALAVNFVAEESLPVSATSVSELEQQIRNHQNELNNLTNKVDTLSDDLDLVQEMIEDLNAEIINTMTSIGMKEDEIEAKKAELADKQAEIERTEEEYEAAKAREEKQYADMVAQIRSMYENGETSYLSLILDGNGLSDTLNRMDFAEKVYSYSHNKLEEYEAAKNQVHDLWDFLEAEKAQLELDEIQLQEDKDSLELLKSNLDASLARKRQESANYEAEIKKAKQDAAVAKAQLQQEQQQLKKLQEAQRAGTTAAATGTYATTNYTAAIDNASGSDMGKRVAKYACQYIGNPYVSGGTSLTNGADCSGFTFRVYSDFGYSLPRTSYEQRSAGTGVDYSAAQPGDLICYDGHVALYIGGGLIVHASTPQSGIKVSNAGYRTILAVRRIV